MQQERKRKGQIILHTRQRLHLTEQEKMIFCSQIIFMNICKKSLYVFHLYFFVLSSYCKYLLIESSYLIGLIFWCTWCGSIGEDIYLRNKKAFAVGTDSLDGNTPTYSCCATGVPTLNPGSRTFPDPVPSLPLWFMLLLHYPIVINKNIKHLPSGFEM